MYQMSHPGDKLNFMGNEFAPYLEWRYYEELEWFMLRYPRHREMRDFVRDLNHLYLRRAPFWEIRHSWDGFQWLQADDREHSIFAYARKAADDREIILVILNMTPAPYLDYVLPVPKKGLYRLLLNSDAPGYGGSGYGGIDGGAVWETRDNDCQEDSARAELQLSLPPLAGLYLEYLGERED